MDIGRFDRGGSPPFQEPDELVSQEYRVGSKKIDYRHLLITSTTGNFLPVPEVIVKS
jgi:hypothetical protein